MSTDTDAGSGGAERPVTVWMVEMGEYSQRFVLGIYSSREKAEAAAGSDGDVSEVIVDAKGWAARTGMAGYRVYMDQGGNNAHVDRFAPSCIPDGDVRAYRDGSIHTTVLARSEEHAIKIANERRIMWLAREPANPTP